MTKVLSLVLALMFIGFFTGAAEAGRCDHEKYQWGTVVKPFCREKPKVGIYIGIPHGQHGHRCHRGCSRNGHRPMMQHRPMPAAAAGPPCNRCVAGYVPAPRPGHPCGCGRAY